MAEREAATEQSPTRLQLLDRLASVLRAAHFCENLLQHVEFEIPLGQDALEARVFLFQLRRRLTAAASTPPYFLRHL